MQNEHNQYEQMVVNLAKRGEDIISNLTPQEAHLWHMATGIAGEAGELMEAFMAAQASGKLDAANVREEIGDTQFYMTGIYNVLESEPMNIDFPECANPFEIVAHIVIAGSNILDQIKKHVIYNRALDTTRIWANMYALDYMLRQLCIVVGSSFEECKEENMKKLLTGPKARYEEGEFSNAAAQARRDKQ
jgi:NTP pyrophosphatase (non-canonical NTP hydrolase)